MATIRLPIINAHSLPDTSGGVYFGASSAADTNDVYVHSHLVFSSQSAKQGVSGKFTVPKNFVDTAKVVVVWRTSATSGDVVWDFDYTAVGGDNAESMDPAAHQESVTVTDTAGGAALRRMECSVALTDANLAVDDEVLFVFSRDAVDAADTLAATAYVEAIFFEYQNT